MATFRQVWNLAGQTGLTFVDSPSKKVRIQKRDNERKRYLTDDEADSLLSALREKSEQAYHLSLVSLDSGARFSEIARFKWSHLDIDNGIITLFGFQPPSFPYQMSMENFLDIQG